LALKEEAEAEVERANEAKAKFLAAASHDLRQPMQAIRLFLEALALRLVDHPQRSLVFKAMEALEGGESLLHGLLDYSILQAGTVTADIRPFQVATVLSRLSAECERHAESKGLALRILPCDAVVCSDPVLLQRILRNLIWNSIRYTDSGAVLVGCRRRGAHIRIDVIDTGSGIPSDKLNRIFEEFYQVANRGRNSSEGLGLGLSIVDKMAKLLNHPLSVCSVEGKGSTFSVMVPLAAANNFVAGRRIPAVVLPAGEGTLS
ncbi:MAG: HAMP domain-containing histidine kinase, partial [Rhodospirillales bacterium]|nr:HAMP domain-containing histidine kinase [Rhodospirillales bacterium]